MTQKPPSVNINVDPGLSYLTAATIIPEGSLQYGSSASLAQNAAANNALQKVSSIVYVNNTMRAAGANNEIQLNINGTISGDNELRYDANTNVLSAGGLVLTNDLTVYGTTRVGNVTALKIGGGNPGDFLVNRGNGNVNWGTPSDYQLPTNWNATTGPTRIVNKPQLANIAVTGSYFDLTNAPALALVATTANYSHLVNRPIIPGNTSQLQNDSGFITASDLSNVNLGNATFNSTVNWSNVAGRPTTVSAFTNDAGYMTAAQVQAYVTSRLAELDSSINIDGGTAFGDTLDGGSASSNQTTTIDGGIA